MKIAADHLFFGESETRAGRIVIENGLIVDLLEPGESDLDLGNALLCSGFVNAHIHLDLSIPPAKDHTPEDFGNWLGKVVESRRSLGPKGLSEAAARGIEECMASGTTAVFDIDPSGHSLQPLENSDLKRVIFREVISLTDEFEDQKSLLDFLGADFDPKKELRAISPHSPYTVSPMVMDRLLDLSKTLEKPWAIHVAESEWEEELLTSTSGPGADFLRQFETDPAAFHRGTSFIQSLVNQKKLSQLGLVIHGNHCSDEELDQMAKSGVPLVWCPSSHQYFRRPPHPAPEAHLKGVKVLLGTDGLISCGHLSMLQELRHARAAAKEISAHELWSMVTVNPRSWLNECGHGELLGSGRLEVGDPADLVAITIPKKTPAKNESVLETALQGSLLACWIDGRVTNSLAPNGPDQTPSEGDAP